MKTIPGWALLVLGLIITGLALTSTTSHAAPPVDLRAVQVTPTPPGGSIHTVQPGETIISIAIQYGLTLDEITTANPSLNPDFIRIGQELVIPAVPPTPTPTPHSGHIHRVQPGETIISIAIRYGLTLDKIEAANELADLDLIGVGEVLIIPTGPSTPTPPPTPTKIFNDPALADVQVGFVCPANGREHNLALSADPIRLTLTDDNAYFLADGDLYAAPVEELNHGTGPMLTNLMPDGRRIGQYTARELVYLTVEPQSGDLLLLDKSNDIYRYIPYQMSDATLARIVAARDPESEALDQSGTWRMEFAAAPVPGQFPDPQYLALQAVGDNLYVLDSDLIRIWRFEPGATLPESELITGRLLTAVDFIFPENSRAPDDEARTDNAVMMVLSRSGEVSKYIGGRPVLGFEDAREVGDSPWPAQIFSLGETIAVVDGEQRSIVGMDANTGEIDWAVVLHFPGMHRLRGAAVHGEMLYALAGPNLYVTNLRATATDDSCPPVDYDDAFYFDGVDIQQSMPDYALPFPGATLPPRPRSYPGARRLYRFGIHKGVDLYGLDVAGLGIGSPILALANGEVSRADYDYVEMTPSEFEAVIARTETEHQTPPDLTDKLRGQQVKVAHPDGVESWYAHLSAVAPAISVGSAVAQGDEVGTVGVSGTSSGAYGITDGTHLHFEIWINDRYLGQGLSLYETMRLWQAVFE